jgi:hypothetical protein
MRNDVHDEGVMVPAETSKSVGIDTDGCLGGEEGDVIFEDIGPIDPLDLGQIPQDGVASITHGQDDALKL